MPRESYETHSGETNSVNGFFFSSVDGKKGRLEAEDKEASRQLHGVTSDVSESTRNGERTTLLSATAVTERYTKNQRDVSDKSVAADSSPLRTARSLRASDVSKQLVNSTFPKKAIASTIPATKTLRENLFPDKSIGQDHSDRKNSPNPKYASFIRSRIQRIFKPARSLLESVTRKIPRKIEDDGNDNSRNENNTSSGRQTLRRLWRRRHARTLEEGIRRERTDELSLLMNKAQIDASQNQDRTYVERTLMGVINVLAEEIEDLDIDISTVRKSPLWRKEVEELRINFSRLGFRPIRMGGTSVAIEHDHVNYVDNVKDGVIDGDNVAELTADEGFRQIDEDNSGFLDRDELAQALSSISPLETDRNSIDELASELLLLYDVNGDGVVDREEYQQMVEDMARLRTESKLKSDSGERNPLAAVTAVKESIQSVSQEISKKAAEVATAARDSLLHDNTPEQLEEIEKGSIVLSDLKLDLRRLLFGAFPIVKIVTPGGPLILEPFTATVTASFSREDVMGSFLLDAGLRRLVARALRVRVRSFRDVVDGALFFGRRWKMTSKTAPVVEVLGLSNVEFDAGNKMVVTGRARIRTSPDAPVVTNTFKVRTKIGTRRDGHVIRLVEPELAFIFECPETLDRLVQSGCRALGLVPPKRPEPVYSFFPIYSPFKVDDNDGFDMGDDNRNGKLQFQMSVVLRPGRFLGNHYIAFTLPMRTFIITMDRVWEGIRAARENKKVAARARKLREKAAAETPEDLPLLDKSFSQSQQKDRTPHSRVIQALKNRKPKPISFFSRFVEGYTLLESQGEAKNERLTTEISDWFGRQGETHSSAAIAPNNNATSNAY
jgi:hypothetical protein